MNKRLRRRSLNVILLAYLPAGDDVGGAGAPDGRAAGLRCRRQGGGSSGDDARHADDVRRNADGSVHRAVLGVVGRCRGARPAEQHRQRPRYAALAPQYFRLLRDLLSSPIFHYCVWSGITGHNLAPEKRDNNYTL